MTISAKISAIHNLRQLVSDIAEQITTLEKEARAILQENYSEEAYRDIMRQKATLLASLEDKTASLVALLPSTDHTNAMQERLAQFSKSASNALQLNSVFYMSALLFPEDHKDGTPNDLDLFITDYLN